MGYSEKHELNHGPHSFRLLSTKYLVLKVFIIFHGCICFHTSVHVSLFSIGVLEVVAVTGVRTCASPSIIQTENLSKTII